MWGSRFLGYQDFDSEYIEDNTLLYNASNYEINDGNIRELVNTYLTNKNNLPNELKRVTINDWNVSRVTNMRGLFENKPNFNEPLDRWNVSNVTYMGYMFKGCSNFNKPLGSWNVSNVESMHSMFRDCSSFNQSLTNWDVSKVKDMTYMFYKCKSFNQPLNNWNVSRVLNMDSMFYECKFFNQPLDRWNISRVRNMNSMFYKCERLSYLPGWQLTPGTSTNNMYEGSGLKNWILDYLEGTQLRSSRVQFHPTRQAHLTDEQLNERINNVLQNFNQEQWNNLLDDMNWIQTVHANETRREWGRGRRVGAEQQQPGRAFEIHNAFADMDFTKFMDIIKKTNAGEPLLKEPTKFTDSNNPLSPLRDFIKPTNLKENINTIQETIKTYGGYQANKQNIIEVIKFVLTQSPDYTNVYIDNLITDCMNAYEPGQPSCVKGMFERIFTTNKYAIVTLCADEINGKTLSTSASSVACKPVYLELFNCFYPEVDLEKLADDWYKINNNDEGTSPLKDVTKEERIENFKQFIFSKAPKANMDKVNQQIKKMDYMFDTLVIGGKKRRNKTNKRNTKKKINSKRRKTVKKSYKKK